MSKHRERPPLTIRPGASRRLAFFLLVVHGAVLAVAFAIPLDWYWRVVLVAVLLSGFLYALGVHFLYLVPWAVREATWGADGTWILTLVSGERVDARLLPSTYVTASLLVLNFRCGRWQYRALVMLPDALDANLLRRLRARLRLAVAEHNANADAGT